MSAGSPTLTHEVKNDTVILKWVITINRPPSTNVDFDGRCHFGDTYDEEHVVSCCGQIDFRNNASWLIEWPNTN